MESGRLVNRQQRGDRFVDHRGEPGGRQNRENLLRFAQRVGEQHGDRAIVDGRAAKPEDVRGHCLRGRKDIPGEPERGFHDKRLGAANLRSLGRRPSAQLEIPGVEQRSRPGLDETLRGTQHMAGGQKPDRKTLPLPRLAKRQRVQLRSQPPHPGTHQIERERGGDRRRMAPDMVAVRMGHEGQLFGTARVQPEPLGRQMNPALKPDIKHGNSLSCQWAGLPQFDRSAICSFPTRRHHA